MAILPDEICARCGKVITRRAIANLLNGEVVCTPCKKASEIAQRKQLRASDAAQARREINSFPSKIAGVSHNNSDRSSRQYLLGHCRVGDKLRLVRETGNRYSPDAVKIMSPHGAQLGYVTEHSARDVARILDEGGMAWAVISELTGGTSDKPTRGANIDIYYVKDLPLAYGQPIGSPLR